MTSETSTMNRLPADDLDRPYHWTWPGVDEWLARADRIAAAGNTHDAQRLRLVLAESARVSLSRGLVLLTVTGSGAWPGRG